MFRILLVLVLLALNFFSAACNSGSSSSGGSGSVGGVGYSAKDMEGAWNYTENAQGGSQSCAGTMTFSGTGQLTGFTNSCCSGYQKIDAEFWIFQDGYVKGRNYAWCGQGRTDQNPMLKYSMNFTGPDKRTIRGIVDLHYTDPNYTRFDITLSRLTPIIPTPTTPEENTMPQGKRSVKTFGLSGVPVKR